MIASVQKAGGVAARLTGHDLSAGTFAPDFDALPAGRLNGVAVNGRGHA